MVNLGVALSLPSAIRTTWCAVLHALDRAQPRSRAWLRLAVPAVAASAFAASPLPGQIRGRPVGGSPGQAPRANWTVSGGASAIVMGDINDGASRSQWRFGPDPLWQLRGTLEKALDGVSTIGVAAGYGVVDLLSVPFPNNGVVAPVGESAVCLGGCEAQTELWSLMGQFRSGGGPGVHTVFEAQGGVNAFRNLREQATGVSFGATGMQIDVVGALGVGAGVTLSQGVALTLVQDFGMGWHSQQALPTEAARTYRTRSTRATLRFSF
jgi:hypothetical protein